MQKRERSLLQEIRSRLLEKDYRLTARREGILRVFLEKPGSHLSAEDVYVLLKQSVPEIGLATVYRTLELLAGLDVLRKINLDDGRSRYELEDPEALHHHHHLICVSCGAVAAFADDLLESLEKAVGEREGFKVMDHQLKFYGVCGRCQEKVSGIGNGGRSAK